MRIKDLATRATKLLTGNAWFVVDNGTKVEKVAYSEAMKQGVEEYAGSTLAGSARSVKSAIDAFYSDAYLLNGATLVPSNSDLNTYTTAGNYQIKFTSDANTISNMPVKTAGVLKVEISGYANNNYKRQTFYEFNNSNRHIRYTSDNGNTWSTWEQVPTRAEMDTLNLNHTSSADDIASAVRGWINAAVAKGKTGFYSGNMTWSGHFSGLVVANVHVVSPARVTFLYIPQVGNYAGKHLTATLDGNSFQIYEFEGSRIL